ncbi:MAG: molybdopterin-guanine dinucleotide biosynthesis protein B [Acidobacteriota bacterium]
MLPIICFVGASDSGKTTFLERLIPELVARGYRVGTVKHDAHGFEMDHEGKDTWKHRRAGASTIAISSPTMVASIRRVESEMDLEDVAGRFFWNEDILIAEGFKRSHFPKVEIFRKAIEPTPICTSKDNLMALVTDDLTEADVPVFRFDELKKLVDLIEQRFLKDRKHHHVLVSLDGKRVPMNDFVRDIVAGGITGMLSSLRGWESPRKIDIQILLEDD